MSETTIRHAQASVSASSAGGAINLRSVALPVEHGGWGMLGEPLLLGLLVAPSWAGLGVGIASLGAFLAHHPLKLVLADSRQRSAQPRTAAAARFVLLYGTIAAVGLAVARSGQRGWWLPLAAAAPLALVQLAYATRLQGRHLLPELLGGVALGSVVAAEIRAAGLSFGAALAAWAILASKAVGAVLYVRARLRYDRGMTPDRIVPVAAHAGALLMGIAVAVAGYTPWLVAPAFALLLARAAYGLSRFHRRVRPQVVGIQEMVYGFSFVLIVAAGYRLGL